MHERHPSHWSTLSGAHFFLMSRFIEVVSFRSSRPSQSTFPEDFQLLLRKLNRTFHPGEFIVTSLCPIRCTHKQSQRSDPRRPQSNPFWSLWCSPWQPNQPKQALLIRWEELTHCKHAVLLRGHPSVLDLGQLLHARMKEFLLCESRIYLDLLREQRWIFVFTLLQFSAYNHPFTRCMTCLS